MGEGVGLSLKRAVGSDMNIAFLKENNGFNGRLPCDGFAPCEGVGVLRQCRTDILRFRSLKGFVGLYSLLQLMVVLLEI